MRLKHPANHYLENARRGGSALFPKLMMEGKIKSAIQVFSDNADCSHFALDKVIDAKTVHDILLHKHPYSTLS